jgi:hypothetical protein
VNSSTSALMMKKMPTITPIAITSLRMVGRQSDLLADS